MASALLLPRAMNIQGRLLILFSLATPFMSGFTACRYWTDTTIPPSDTTPPVAAPSAILGGDPQIIQLGGLSQTVHSLSMNIIAIPAVWDGGGTQAIDASYAVSVFCNNGQGESLHFVPEHAEQTGTPGSTVSQGIYLLKAFHFSDFASFCDAQGGVHDATFGFQFSGHDFFGNSASNSGAIFYTP